MRHPLSTAHLVAGLVFLGIALSWALREWGVIDTDGGPWVLPVILVAAGAAGLLASVGKVVAGRSGRADVTDDLEDDLADERYPYSA
jgi:hypothetical protein